MISEIGLKGKISNNQLEGVGSIPTSRTMNYEIREIPFKAAKEYISKNHYSKKISSRVRVSLGFFNSKGDLVTCIVYNHPVGKKITGWMHRNNINCAELGRLFSDDGLPKNTESYCIAASFKYLKEHYPEIKYLISYADLLYGHIGGIYQATNWKYTGKSISGHGVFIINGIEIHPKTLFDRHGTSSKNVIKEIYKDNVVIKKRQPLYRYIICIGNKKEKREWYKLFKFMPYPKKEVI